MCILKSVSPADEIEMKISIDNISDATSLYNTLLEFQ